MVLRLSIRLLQNNSRSCKKTSHLYVPTSLHSCVSTAHLTLFYISHVFFVFVFQVPAEIRVPVEQTSPGRADTATQAVCKPQNKLGALLKSNPAQSCPGITGGAVLCPWTHFCDSRCSQLRMHKLQFQQVKLLPVILRASAPSVSLLAAWNFVLRG